MSSSAASAAFRTDASLSVEQCLCSVDSLPAARIHTRRLKPGNLHQTAKQQQTAKYVGQGSARGAARRDEVARQNGTVSVLPSRSD